MKILLLTVTAGHGHNATAQALRALFESRGAEAKVVDVYEYISKVIRTAIARGYLLSAKYAPELYRIFYEKSSRSKDKLNKMNIVKLVNTLGAFKFEHFVDDFSPDAIVCTHVLAAHLVSEMKGRGMVDAPCIGVVTDYCIHPYWEDVVHMEKLVTASELITLSAVKRGIPEERILPIGIPIHPKFNQKLDQADARTQLGLKADRPTILIMSGSMGYGNALKTVAQIAEIKEMPELQILVVCGKNQRTFNRIRAYQRNYQGNCDIHLFAFVDNVEVMMSAADCIITKPGGLTVSESIAKALPMILINPIPGQEERNVEFLLNNGMASLVTKTFPVDEAIYDLFANPARLKALREMVGAIGHPDASERLVDYVMSLDESPTVLQG